jgi:hypothetical protein
MPIALRSTGHFTMKRKIRLGSQLSRICATHRQKILDMGFALPIGDQVKYRDYGNERARAKLQQADQEFSTKNETGLETDL